MTPPREISAVILAAGFSRRMGQSKPLLELGGQTLLQRVLALYRLAGVSDLHVVVGHRADAVTAAVSPGIATLVHNPAYANGMFSSVVAGVGSLPLGAGCFFVHPVDIPLVRPHTLSMLIEAFAQHRPATVYPVFGGVRGHPPLIHADLIAAITADQGSGGLQDVLQRHDSRALDIQVADQAVLLDMDTRDDWRKMSARLTGAHLLTDAECRELLCSVQRLPQPVIAHCEQVAWVAEALARAVAPDAAQLDIALVRSAAMVHDLAKGAHDHAAAGAHMLDQMGFPALAAVVAVHMEMAAGEDSPLDAAQLVHLADKLVEGADVVGLQRRFAAKLQRHGADSNAAAEIARRQETALTIQRKIERSAGMNIDRILEKAARDTRG